MTTLDKTDPVNKTILDIAEQEIVEILTDSLFNYFGSPESVATVKLFDSFYAGNELPTEDQLKDRMNKLAKRLLGVK